MKANEVLSLLQISRQTLSRYVKLGLIKVVELPNHQYDYDEESVYKLFNKGVARKNYIYARVSTSKQKKDLENQVEMLKQFCFSNGYMINGVFTDIASGISFEKRKDFFKLLDDVIAGKVERVVITYKDRLSRVGFDLFYYLFQKYHCEIIVMSEVGSAKLDSEEVMDDIINMLHCYSMKLDTKQNIKQIKRILEDKENDRSES